VGDVGLFIVSSFVSSVPRVKHEGRLSGKDQRNAGSRVLYYMSSSGVINCHPRAKTRGSAIHSIEVLGSALRLSEDDMLF